MYPRLYLCFRSKLLNKRQLIINQYFSFSMLTTHQMGFDRGHLPLRLLGFNNVPKLNPTRPFHTTGPKPAIPPFILAILRSALKLFPITAGERAKIWWINLPEDKREQVKQKLKKHRSLVIKGGILFGGLSYIYYIMNLVEDPITKRKKFIIVSDKEIEEMSVIESNKIIETSKNQIIKSGPQYEYLLRITEQILNANKALPGAKRTWQVILIDDIEKKNAFVLPSGHIFVFSGMMAQTSNEDQLATIIGHEISHVLLQHGAEKLSKVYFQEMLLLLPLFVFWALFPDNVASSSQHVTEYMSEVLFRLPFSRKLETEADILGLEMMARACYDPRQASAFWRKIDQLSKDEQNEWMSTHPSHKTRYETLDKLTSKVLRIRTKYCSKKGTDDSRDSSRTKK